MTRLAEIDFRNPHYPSIMKMIPDGWKFKRAVKYALLRIISAKPMTISQFASLEKKFWRNCEVFRRITGG